ncbi:MAG: cytochrome c oxidase accessory protein CcoG [Bacteroidetes bacterium]|nr:cytochrome c oxidase accessory protein CcoG [Bacteroidota bacterium]
MNRDEFRDSVAIVSKEGKRNWIYPRKPKGFFTMIRGIVSIVLLAILFVTPFIRIGGHPRFLLNVIERKFILFGTIFGPHDFYLLGLALITFIIFVILFTVVFGRLFCGWICPQTVFMEMVFRKIDYWIEGDHKQQRRLNESLWTRQKITRKGLKHTIYFVVSFLISNVLLAWVIGADSLLGIVTDSSAEHFAGLSTMLVFTGVFYWIFAWFREQACILVCPYGRLQGVLLDRRSIVIAYDYVRGEPRGRLLRGQHRTAGDCIDCQLCVDVCPTGIDIRNGTQLECVNCTACIDACDMVMEKVKKPKRLIRYDSANGIAEKKRQVWTPRVVGYAVVLTLLAALLTFLLARRTDVDVTVLRTPGMFYQEQPDGRLSNVYDVKVLNKTFEPVSLSLSLEGLNGEIQLIGDSLRPGPQGIIHGKFLVLLEPEEIKSMTIPLRITVQSGGKVVGNVTTTFLGRPSRK